jgi:glucuronokinase
MIIHTCSYPRAGLIGNPSDGYNGKTIAFVFSNFHADITLYQSPELEILPSTRDHSRFSTVQQLVDDVNLYGYYGGVRLLKASIKCFCDYCDRSHIVLDERNFTIRYASNIPHRVGLAGSSAIITACFRALMAFYQVSIPAPILANLILAVEKDELGIAAGLQDRVVQAYEGLVYMDFDKEIIGRQSYGTYKYLDPSLLPPVYIAYRADLSEGSEVVHSSLRERYNTGDKRAHEAVKFWAEITEQFKACLLNGDRKEAARLINANFDKRKEVCAISSGNLHMIEAARTIGASAKFSGSGGAIVGTYRDETMFAQLVSTLKPLNIHVIKPEYINNSGDMHI